jgi:putative sugar O-methyltransferase
MNTTHSLCDRLLEGRVLFEIGGGFGASVHILLQNYPDLKKVLYLDIAPNLYLGTEYFRALYPSSIRHYMETNSIRFREDDSLEILCNAPWQIECVDEGVETDPREDHVGSILGFGYAPYWVGTI